MYALQALSSSTSTSFFFSSSALRAHKSSEVEASNDTNEEEKKRLGVGELGENGLVTEKLSLSRTWPTFNEQPG